MGKAEQEAKGTLVYPKGLLNLEYTLSNGQMFRWRQSADDWWEAVTGERLIRIRKADGVDDSTDTFEFYTYPGEPDEGVIRSFFRLDVDLEILYKSWREEDKHLGELADRFRGLRIVAQKPDECLLSFMCSTANFIPRIMKAIAIIARNWGPVDSGTRRQRVDACVSCC